MPQTNTSGNVLLYTPTQASFITFFGGPFGGIYVLYKNCAVMGKGNLCSKIIGYGLLGTVLAFVSLFFLPGGLHPVVIPLAISFGVQQLVEKINLSKADIAASEIYKARSWKNAIIVSILSLIAILFVLAIIVFGFSLADIYILPEDLDLPSQD